MIELRDIKVEDIGSIGLRPGAQSARLSAAEVEGLLALGAAQSERSHAVWVDGELCCLLGLYAQTLTDETGWVWLSAGEALRRHRVAVARAVKASLDKLPYSRLSTLVEFDAHGFIRWLEWLGFQHESRDGDLLIMTRQTNGH